MSPQEKKEEQPIEPAADADAGATKEPLGQSGAPKGSSAMDGCSLCPLTAPLVVRSFCSAPEVTFVASLSLKNLDCQRIVAEAAKPEAAAEPDALPKSSCDEKVVQLDEAGVRGV